MTLVKGALFAYTKLHRAVASTFIGRLSPFMLRFHFKLKVVFGRGLGVVISNWHNWLLLIGFRFSWDMSSFWSVICLGSYELSIVGLGSIGGVLLLVLENWRNALVCLCISYLVHTISRGLSSWLECLSELRGLPWTWSTPIHRPRVLTSEFALVPSAAVVRLGSHQSLSSWE